MSFLRSSTTVHSSSVKFPKRKNNTNCLAQRMSVIIDGNDVIHTMDVRLIVRPEGIYVDLTYAANKCLLIKKPPSEIDAILLDQEFKVFSTTKKTPSYTEAQPEVPKPRARRGRPPRSSSASISTPRIPPSSTPTPTLASTPASAPLLPPSPDAPTEQNPAYVYASLPPISQQIQSRQPARRLVATGL